MERGVSMKSYPGFKFSPTDEELILYYLRKKIGGQKGTEAIPEIDITRHEPWDLPEKSIIPSNSEWYFFSRRERKYPQGRQTKRATQLGYWKATGNKRNVKSGNQVVGTKRTLVFYKGQAPKWERTEWIMHEYCISGTPQESFVVCRVRNRKNCEFNCNDIPPNELNQPLTDEESSTSTLADRFGSEHCKKPGNINYQHSVESFDSESENDKKPENLLC